MTRYSAHDVSAAVLKDGIASVIRPTSMTVRLSEARYPYGQADVTVPMPHSAEELELLNPRMGDVRLVLDVRESVGDPVRMSEITADHGGSMAALTAAFEGVVAAVTAAYFAPWVEDVKAGTQVRLNFLVTAMEVDHQAGTVALKAYTDEAAANLYRLVSTGPETSGSLTVRDTVNFALSKIGAALIPGPVDAPIDEAAAIVWQPGVTAWDYLRNVAESAGFVVRCDPRRRWTLTRRDEEHPESVVLDRAVRITQRIEADTVQTADAVVVRYDWTDPATETRHTRFDTAALTASPRVVKLVERTVPYPGRGAAAYWLGRLARRGRQLELEQVADYAMRPGMPFGASVPLTPAQLGRIESLEWSLPDAVMTITTTGVVDAVPGAIDLWPVGIYIHDLIGMIHTQNPGEEEEAA